MSTIQSPTTAVVEDSRVAQIASATGWILCALALIVLSGWAFQVSPLTSVVPGLATMKSNTAAAFLLTGLTLLRRQHRDGPIYSLGVLVIGTATLIEYLSNLDFGIDQLLFRDPYSAVAPGRMSQITSVGFALLGPALALIKTQSQAGRRVSRGLGLVTGAMGVIALLGYSYDTKALYQVRPYSSVALHTAIGFVIAAIGVQYANPGEGVVHRIHADSAGGAMLRRLLPAALLIPYLLGFTAWIVHKYLGWEMGFSLALVVAATIFCLILIMLLNAKHLEREDLARREMNHALEERTVLLRAREELLRTFVKHAPVAVAMLDRDMRYLLVSDRWCSYYSLDSAHMLGRSHYEIAPDIPERWKQMHRRALAGETVHIEEDRWDRADGRASWSRREFVPWGSREDGLPAGILVFSEDITERKQAEQERRKFVSLVDHSTEFIGMCDMDFKPFYVNPAGRQLVGLDSLEQACLTPVQEFFFPEDQRFIYEEFFPRVLREGSAEVEVRFRHFKTGVALWMIYNVFHITDDAGRPAGLATVSRDITARKQVEEKLRNSEQQLRVLAGSLLSAQENERRRLSRELHDDITQRLAFLSIELGKLASEMPDSLKATRATICTLQEQTLQASTEVRRLSRGLHPSVIEDFGLSIALEEFCGEFEKAQGVRVIFEGLVDDPRLDDASATCLYRITQESLRNAVIHGRATEVHVTLSVGPECMQLRVTDNGTGFSTDSMRTKTGLGVVSMRERIRLVNGSLTLSSQPGKGTEVTASVPLVGVGHE